MTDGRGIVFLDRDGTLIGTDVREGLPVASNDPDSLVILPGVVEGCRELKRAGHRLVMVTNQPDVPRGRARREHVEAINGRLSETLDLDLVMVCYHDDHDDCNCRKPRPGMLLEGARQLGVELSRSSVIVGDRWRDVHAGLNAGISTVQIGSGYGETVQCNPDAAVGDFLAAVKWIESKGSQRR